MYNVNDIIKGKLLKTAGIVTVGAGMYLIHKGIQYDSTDKYNRVSRKDIIDVEWWEED